MVMNDPLANVLSHIYNSEKIGRKECIVTPKSKLILEVLRILKENLYMGDFDVVSNANGGMIKVNLLGNINKCGVVKPKFSFTKKNYENFEKRYLPAKDFGFFIVSTSKGVMTHKEALSKGIGGRLIAYCY